MDPKVSAPVIVNFGDEEWEVHNEDGFIYKQKKRLEESAGGESYKQPDPEVDPAEEERNRRKRKRKILVELKRKYQKEISEWDMLSNNLCSEKSNEFEWPSSIETEEDMEKEAYLMEELLSMEEGREGIMEKVRKECERAEEMCKREEEMLFNLPVWGSPLSLMASLSHES